MWTQTELKVTLQFKKQKGDHEIPKLKGNEMKDPEAPLPRLDNDAAIELDGDDTDDEGDDHDDLEE